jgi:hypothetical protein
VQQTPLVDYEESIYRYRFQGTIFAEREGFLTSSDAGLSTHYVLPGNYGDVHAGFYNGEGYSKAEANNQKALQLRATIRPLPSGGVWKGLRVTAFYDGDHYLKNAARRRAVEQVTFESKPVNAGVDFLQARDRTSARTAETDANGWSAWATPRLINGWELLLRHDQLAGTRKRNIAGVAYWVPNLQKVTAAVMLDYDALRVSSKPNDTRYGLKLLVSF